MASGVGLAASDTTQNSRKLLYVDSTLEKIQQFATTTAKTGKNQYMTLLYLSQGIPTALTISRDALVGMRGYKGVWTLFVMDPDLGAISRFKLAISTLKIATGDNNDRPYPLAEGDGLFEWIKNQSHVEVEFAGPAGLSLPDPLRIMGQRG